MKNTKKTLLGAFSLLLAIAGAPTHAQLRITEIAPWASGNSPYSNDWFELTNLGASTVSISGWRMDDSSAAFASSVALTGITDIQAGESVIFLENAAGNAGFVSTWFGMNPPAGLQVGNFTGGGVGLSTSGDAVNIFDMSGALQASVSFGASDSTAPFQSFDNSAALNNAAISLLSENGINGAFVAAQDANEIGSPGAIAAVPEPATYVLMLAGLGVIGAIARKRSR